MKTKRRCPAKLILKLRYNSCIDEACKLETMLAKKPASVKIDILGVGELPPDSALLIRSVLLARSPRTHVITNARSSLQGAAVLIWLLGDSRLIREDASLFFRSAGEFETDKDGQPSWKDRDLFGDDGQEESQYIRVLQLINEFLPVKELADEPVQPSVLKQFGLVDNEQVDGFLATVFAKSPGPSETRPGQPEKRVKRNAKPDRSREEKK